MPDGYVIRVIEPGWEQEETAAIVGPFADADGVAEALEAAGYRRSDPAENALEAHWGKAIEVLPLVREMPAPR